MRHSVAPKRHLALLSGLVLTVLLAGCKPSNTYHAPPPPPVITSKPVLMPMTTYLYVTGSTVAVNSVQLVARVSGYLDRIDYTDGSIVKKGQLLFVIEPEPYAAKLKQAVAAIAQAKAQVLYAQSQYDRQLQMIKQNATSQANVEQWLATRGIPMWSPTREVGMSTSFGSTATPGRTCCRPLTITCSPGLSPPVISRRPLWSAPNRTGRESTSCFLLTM